MEINKKGNRLYYFNVVEEPNTKKDSNLFESPLGGEKINRSITMEIAVKIIPDDVKDQLVDFLEQKNQVLTSLELNNYLKENSNYTLDDFEDFDRNIHMTEEERKESDALAIKLKNDLPT